MKDRPERALRPADSSARPPPQPPKPWPRPAQPPKPRPPSADHDLWVQALARKTAEEILQGAFNIRHSEEMIESRTARVTGHIVDAIRATFARAEIAGVNQVLGKRILKRLAEREAELRGTDPEAYKRYVARLDKLLEAFQA